MRQIWQQINEAAFFFLSTRCHTCAHAGEKALAGKALLFTWIVTDFQATWQRRHSLEAMLTERGTKGNVEEREPSQPGRWKGAQRQKRFEQNGLFNRTSGGAPESAQPEYLITQLP